MRGRICILLLSLWLAACGRSDEPIPLTRSIAPDESLIEPPESHMPDPLSAAAIAKRDHILKAADTGMMRPLSRIADAEPDFVSNIGGMSHITYWTLLRRTGADPGATLVRLFSEPYDAKEVGEEIWYVWPDFAAREPEALIPERLSFRDRARLMELVGEDGIARIRDGHPYPGLRTAIAEDGRWVYFIYNEELIMASETGEPE